MHHITSKSIYILFDLNPEIIQQFKILHLLKCLSTNLLQISCSQYLKHGVKNLFIQPIHIYTDILFIQSPFIQISGWNGQKKKSGCISRLN